jgi:cysteine synthase
MSVLDAIGNTSIVSSDAFSREKLDHMAALGAELTLVPSEGGLTTRKQILEMIEVARRLSREPDTYWTDQLNNHDSITGYYGLGEEIWRQTDGKVDAFVHCVGTAASSRGVATVLKYLSTDVYRGS